MKKKPALSARTVLKAILVSKRQGTRIIDELDEREPDLAEYLTEELSSIHSALWNLCEEPRPTAKLQKQITQMACVLIEAMRRSGKGRDTGRDPAAA